MQVKLHFNAWIGGNFYRADQNPNTIPDEFRDVLPKTAIVLDKPVVVEPPKPTPTLKDMDTERATTDVTNVRTNRK